MKSGFFLKTAWNNLKKNYRFYIPEILTGTGLLACFYIVLTLALDERLAEVKGGSMIPLFMMIGVIVIALLSITLIFYTNTFLMRQRKREYGLYNVLGMEKRHVGAILFYETAISAVISVLSGLLLGVLFYKLCSLLICRLLKTEVVIGFYFLKPFTLLLSGGFFLLLYLASFIINRISLAKLNVVDLLSSKSVGEKEPKVKWVLLILGLLTLGGGYAISVLTTKPLDAILLFFVAVFLVIIGTYFLFTAGSIFVLKALKKSPSYYYQKRHMTSVSGLLYRMKQNAVGLASICILATGVLVMLSCTISLYGGLDQIIETTFPQDMYVYGNYDTEDGESVPIPAKDMETIIQTAADKHHLAIENFGHQSFLSVGYRLDGDTLSMNPNDSFVDYSDIILITYMTAKDYEANTGIALNLQKDEVAYMLTSDERVASVKLPKALHMEGKTLTLKDELSTYPIQDPTQISVTATFGFVVADDAVLQEIADLQKNAYNLNASQITDRTAVTFKEGQDLDTIGPAFEETLWTDFDAYITQNIPNDGYGLVKDTIWAARESLLSMYGCLLFLGIILGLVCLFATVLIIYYKQISEGYEDRNRYQIMKKVGMSDKEIKQSIRSQTLLVFFLPLLFAGLHTAFAFPILNRMLHIFLLSSTNFFIACTVVSFIVFALVYITIYSLTAKTYYKIVN